MCSPGVVCNEMKEVLTIQTSSQLSRITASLQRHCSICVIAKNKCLPSHMPDENSHTGLGPKTDALGCSYTIKSVIFLFKRTHAVVCTNVRSSTQCELFDIDAMISSYFHRLTIPILISWDLLLVRA